MKSLLYFLVLLGCSGTWSPGASPADSRIPLATANEDYRIAPRDFIEFQVQSQTDTTTRQRVTASGELQLPFVGTVKVAGQTVREAEKSLEKSLREGGFFVAPQVILSVDRYRERYISLLGQVKNPDRIEFPLETTAMGILQAVARVGGFTRIARTDAVQILRTSANGEQERIIVNMDEFLKPKTPSRAATEFQLVPGDVVFVPERAF